MKAENVVVIGKFLSLQWHCFSFEGLMQNVHSSKLMHRKKGGHLVPLLRKAVESWCGLRLKSLKRANDAFQKRAAAFRDKSKRLDQQIYRRPVAPDFILHIFATYRPFWNPASIVYALFLDFIFSLSGRTWPTWAASVSSAHRSQWLIFEKENYTDAYPIFYTSTLIEQSLIENYYQPDYKITVVRATGNFLSQSYIGSKTFGSKNFSLLDLTSSAGAETIDFIGNKRTKMPSKPYGESTSAVF